LAHDKLKKERQEKLAIREQFEAEHDDANINFLDKDKDNQSEEEYHFNLDFIIRKTNFKKSKFGGIPHYSKKHVSTFGTVKRFAPEPGSI
jgi:hypothetical protein